jgi:Domain of unknown function (DUF4956)
MPDQLFQIETGAMIEFVSRALLNIAGMTVLVFGLYYRRYKDKELATACALFNIFIFAVLSILSSVNFSVAAGFGLFAILALFTLRSEPLTKLEMTYFFGSVAISVITSIYGSHFGLSVAALGLVLAGAYIVDHPRILRAVSGAKVTLDHIPPDMFTNETDFRGALSARLGVNVLSFQVIQLDYISEMVKLHVFFSKHS